MARNSAHVLVSTLFLELVVLAGMPCVCSPVFAWCISTCCMCHPVPPPHILAPRIGEDESPDSVPRLGSVAAAHVVRCPTACKTLRALHFVGVVPSWHDRRRRIHFTFYIYL